MVEATNGVSKLAQALAKAQGSFPAIPKNKTTTVRTKTGGQYTYTYADLPSILDLTRKPLSENGLSVAQMTTVHEGAMVLITRLMHASGEYIEATYPLPINATAQDMGSAITYARRYSLSPLIGIAPDDDDDGKAAQENDVQPSHPKSFTTDPRQQKKDAEKSAKKEAPKAPEAPKESSPANVTVKSIAPGNHPTVKFSKLETSGGQFIVMGDNQNFSEIMKEAQKAALSQNQVVIFYHLNAKNSQVVDSLKVEE